MAKVLVDVFGLDCFGTYIPVASLVTNLVMYLLVVQCN